jgi:hypothetical protein
VEAFVGKKLVDGELVGRKLASWSTFRIEGGDKDAVYTELLAVDPTYQKMGSRLEALEIKMQRIEARALGLPGYANKV